MVEIGVENKKVIMLGTTSKLPADQRKTADSAVKVLPNKRGFVRVKIINGRPYYSRVCTVYDHGKRRQVMLEYYGTTLPHGVKLGSQKK